MLFGLNSIAVSLFLLLKIPHIAKNKAGDYHSSMVKCI